MEPGIAVQHHCRIEKTGLPRRLVFCRMEEYDPSRVGVAQHPRHERGDKLLHQQVGALPWPQVAEELDEEP